MRTSSWTPAEYSFYFERCYPLADDRRAYFQNLVKVAQPGYGYRLLATARQAGRQAFYVAGYGFDDTLRRLALQCLDGELGERAKAILAESTAARAENNRSFSLPIGEPAALIKSNCFPVDCPSEVYEFEVPDLQREGAWAALRETIQDKPIVAGLLGRKVVAMGFLAGERPLWGLREATTSQRQLHKPRGRVGRKPATN